jgi:hypothetical protein
MFFKLICHRKRPTHIVRASNNNNGCSDSRVIEEYLPGCMTTERDAQNKILLNHRSSFIVEDIGA